MSLAKYRRDFPITKSFNFLDHANMAPSPVQVVRAVNDLMKEKAAFAYMKFDKWNATIDKLRDNMSTMIGANRQGIWFVNNTSDGINILANGIDWKKGDSVVMPDIEFPSVVYPFLKRRERISVRYAKSRLTEDGVDVPLYEFERCIDDSTRLVCVSSVDFGYGTKYELRKIGEIAHAHNAFFFIDASQSVGVAQMQVDLEGVDALALGGQKWTLAPSGGGILYINPRLFDRFEPPNVGWMSVDDSVGQFAKNYTEHYTLAPDARRFATGHLNFPGILGLAASTQYLLDVGLARIETQIRHLTRALMDGATEMGLRILTPQNDNRRAGIVSFEISEPAAVIDHLKKSRIVVSGAVQTRGRGIRVSPHFYNTTQEIVDLITEVRRIREKST